MPYTMLDKAEHGSYERRLKVAEVAIKLFEKKGVKETSIEEITEMAGVSERTFFRYFSSKEATLFADHPRRARIFREELDNRTPSSTPFVSIFDVLKKMARSMSNQRERTRYVLINSDTKLIEMSRIANSVFENYIADYIISQTSEDSTDYILAHTFAAACVSLHRTLSTMWVKDPDAPLMELLDEALSMLSKLLPPEEATSAPQLPITENDLLILIPRSSDTRELVEHLIQRARTNEAE